MAYDSDEDVAGAAAEPLRLIRALTRGLKALEALNRTRTASVTEVARAVGLPRTTAYRVLETLCASGYAARDPAGDRYRLLPATSRLTDGLQSEAWIETAARPAVAALAKDLSWPITVATLRGTAMAVTSVDGRTAESPARLPLLASSAGLAFLAFAAPAQRKGLVDALAFSNDPEDESARNAAALEQVLAGVATRGAAMVDDGAADVNLAVPILIGDPAASCALASLVMTVARSAMADQAVDRFTGLLSRTAAEIARTFENEAAARRK